VEGSHRCGGNHISKWKVFISKWGVPTGKWEVPIGKWEIPTRRREITRENNESVSLSLNEKYKEHVSLARQEKHEFIYLLLYEKKVHIYVSPHRRKKCFLADSS
jgi:hypothetical protein